MCIVFEICKCMMCDRCKLGLFGRLGVKYILLTESVQSVSFRGVTRDAYGSKNICFYFFIIRGNLEATKSAKFE